MSPIPQELQAILSLCSQRAVDTGARRLFHGRGQQVPGFGQVTIDSVASVILVTLYRALPAEILEPLVSGLWDRLGGRGFRALVIQRRLPGGATVDVVRGVLPEALWAEEDGLRYRIDLMRGQNPGFFLDMRLARTWLRERAAGKSVLNLFAFTCAFSVVARAGGAARVVNIDLSRPSLAIGRDNHLVNGLSVDDVHFLGHDLFRSWKKLHGLGRYDIIVMDPPTAQKGSFVAEKDYAKVVRRFPKLLKPAADVLACLNATHLGEGFLDEVFFRELPGAVRVARLPNPPEFADADPQSALKVIHYRYERPDNLPPLVADDESDD